MHKVGWNERMTGVGPNSPLLGSAVRAGRANSEAELFTQAKAAWEAGEAEAFLPTLERALPAATDYRLWHIHGLIQRQLDRRELALPSLRRAVELNPSAANPALALARTLYEAGLPSVDAFGHALRLSPGSPEIVSGLALALVGAGEVAMAIHGLESILSRSPLWTDGQTMLAQFRWMEGAREGFTRGFDEALRQYPNSLDLRREQLILLIHAEQWDAALRAIADGREAVGEQPLFAMNEAVVRSESGESHEAERLFAAFAEVQDGPLQIRRVRHYLRMGRPDEAVAIMEPWLGRAEAFMFWPYASVAWRQTHDPRWIWLEGDDRFVGVYDLADKLPPLGQLADTLRKLHTLSGQPLEQSLRGGSQTDGDLFKRIDPVIVALREAVRLAVAEHVAQLPPFDAHHPLLSPRRNEIRFAGSWSVWLRKAGFHSNHVHPAGWLSSALYIVLPPDLGLDQAGYLSLGQPHSTCFDVDLPAMRTITPAPGRLVLFPSYMWHGTRPFGAGERLSVAFDVARLT